MPHRKLVKIGDTPKLPTIQEFFILMADRQRDEILKLKAEIAGVPHTSEVAHPKDPRIPVPDPWLLHPMRVKRAPAKKKAAKKRASSKRPGRKAAKKTSGRPKRRS